MIVLPILVCISAVLGACIGSFLNVVAWRLPRNQSLGGRSACPNCHHVLGAQELVPIFSFIWQGGRCRHCGAGISVRYASIELITAFLFGVSAWLMAPFAISGYLMLLLWFVVVATCVVVFVIDLEHYLILDKVIIAASSMVLLLLIAIDATNNVVPFSIASSTLRHVIAALCWALPFWFLWRISKGTWMGFGDVKYAAFMGLTLGPVYAGVGIFVAFIVGAFFSVALLLLAKKQLSSKIPFGTFLSIGTVIALWWGVSLLNMYLAMIGLR